MRIEIKNLYSKKSDQLILDYKIFNKININPVKNDYPYDKNSDLKPVGKLKPSALCRRFILAFTSKLETAYDFKKAEEILKEIQNYNSLQSDLIIDSLRKYPEYQTALLDAYLSHPEFIEKGFFHSQHLRHFYDKFPSHRTQLLEMIFAHDQLFKKFCTPLALSFFIHDFPEFKERVFNILSTNVERFAHVFSPIGVIPALQKEDPEFAERIIQLILKNKKCLYGILCFQKDFISWTLARLFEYFPKHKETLFNMVFNNAKLVQALYSNKDKFAIFLPEYVNALENQMLYFEKLANSPGAQRAWDNKFGLVLFKSAADPDGWDVEPPSPKNPEDYEYVFVEPTSLRK